MCVFVFNPILALLHLLTNCEIASLQGITHENSEQRLHKLSYEDTKNTLVDLRSIKLMTLTLQGIPLM